MEDAYEMQLLEIIKKYNPKEYNTLINGDKVAVEDHLDELARQFPNLEDFEKTLKEDLTKEEAYKTVKGDKVVNEIFETALLIAAKAHKGQVDKNGQAYILHPLAVAAQLDDLELKTIAVLHDTIEDTDVTVDYLISQGIPKDIVEVVELLSRPKDEDYESYLHRVKENSKAKAVKLADLAHNTDPSRVSGLNEKRREKYALVKKILTN